MGNVLKRLITEEKGQGLTEYALLLGIIAVAIVGIYALNLGTTISNKFSAIKDSLTGTTPTTPTTP
ncbi:MAG TPA: Flp family type IVb pilin [Bacillota bacterium]|nr:Flp family type IVb pilin [Bacillota bacterium]